MTGEALESTTRTFNFSYPTCTNEEVMFRLSVPLALAPRPRARELVQRLIRMFHVPVYLENELNEKLSQFIAEETKKFHDARDAALLGRLRGAGGGGEGAAGAAAGGAESAVRLWERRFKDHVFEFAEHKGTSEEEEFAALYHKLVHSPALAGVLRAEAGYAAAARAAAAARDRDIADLTLRQTEEMEEAVRLLNVSWSEQQINALAARHFEAQALAQARWGSQLDALAHAQRAEHRRALRQATPLSPLSPSAEASSPAGWGAGAGGGGAGAAAGAAWAEESFTIHLGSQLKQTHNLRIVAADVEDLFETPHADDASAESRQLQTALALYSGELSGVVVLRGGGGGGGGPAAARLSTDHHFPALDQQLQRIAELTREPIEKRNQARHERRVSEAAAGAGAGATAGAGLRARRGPQTGDVLVTRHGNLPDAHVVFHLVINDDDLKSGDMTSRHPCVLGLRSVLQAASCNDVTSLALPLLLRHELSEVRHDVTAPVRARAAQRAAGRQLQRRHQPGAAAAAAPRAERGDDGGVVRAARGAGAEVCQRLHAGGGGRRRRPAAHADAGGAARAAAARVRRAALAAARRVPPLHAAQDQAARPLTLTPDPRHPHPDPQT